MERQLRSMKKCPQITASEGAYALHCKIMNASKKEKKWSQNTLRDKRAQNGWQKKHTNCGYCVIQYSANSCIEKCGNWGIRNGLPCIQVCLGTNKRWTVTSCYESDKQARWICYSRSERRLESCWSFAAKKVSQICVNDILLLKNKWKQCLRSCGYRKATWRERDKSTLFLTVHCWGEIRQSVIGHIRDIYIACKNKEI